LEPFSQIRQGVKEDILAIKSTNPLGLIHHISFSVVK
jgi:hypothetical protein